MAARPCCRRSGEPRCRAILFCIFASRAASPARRWRSLGSTTRARREPTKRSSPAAAELAEFSPAEFTRKNVMRIYRVLAGVLVAVLPRLSPAQQETLKEIDRYPQRLQ